jgi:hypothetical protein
MEIKKFARWPIKVTSGKRVWLQYYWHHTYRYDPVTGRPPIFSQTFEWTETPQEKIWRLIKYSAAD